MEHRDMQPMEKLSLQTATDVQSNYERRCLETLETALNRTPIYRSWKTLDSGPGDGIDARYHSLPVLTKDDIRAYFPKGVVPRRA